MKLVVFLALLGVAAARPQVLTVSEQGIVPASTSKTEESSPKVVAYSYPFYGGFPFYYPGFPYTSPYGYPFVFPSPEAKKSDESSRKKRSAGAEPEPEAEADADPFTFYTSFPSPTTTTYKFPAATFPVASPYTKFYPYQYAFPFPYAFVAKKN